MKMKNIISVIASVLLLVLEEALGGFDDPSRTLIIFMIIDYLIGIAAAFMNKEFNSKTGFKGIIKKIATVIVVAVAVQVDKTLGTEDSFRNLSLFYLISMEGLSILENVAKLGVPIPNVLKDKLEQLADMDDKGDKDEDI